MGVSMQWLKGAAQKVIGAFLLAFLGQLVAAGTGAVHLGSLHVAVNAGITAGLATLEALVANVVYPSSTAIITAVRDKRAAAKA